MTVPSEPVTVCNMLAEVHFSIFECMTQHRHDRGHAGSEGKGDKRGRRGARTRVQMASCSVLQKQTYQKRSGNRNSDLLMKVCFVSFGYDAQCSSGHGLRQRENTSMKTPLTAMVCTRAEVACCACIPVPLRQRSLMPINFLAAMGRAADVVSDHATRACQSGRLQAGPTQL
jgi:hypothetical protein